MKSTPKRTKGDTLMMVVIVAIVATLLAGIILMGIGGQIIHALGTEDLICPRFCAMQAEIEDASIGGWLRGFLGGGEDRMTFSDYWANNIGDLLINPGAMGCYCGVEKRSGQFIHFYTRGEFESSETEIGHEDASLGEFHITKQSPDKHLRYHIIDSDGDTVFRHTGGLDACNDSIRESDTAEELGINELHDLRDYEGCVIFAPHKKDDDDYGCSIWGFSENFAITNFLEKSILDQVERWPQYMEDFEDVDDVATKLGEESIEDSKNSMKTLKIGDRIENRGRHASQRMLLEKYISGTNSFEVYAPIVCSSAEREGQEARDELDEACMEHCKEQGRLFWDAACLESRRGDYEPLDRDFTGGEGDNDMWDFDDWQYFCPEVHEDPYCMCIVEKDYYWEVDEDYEVPYEYRLIRASAGPGGTIDPEGEIYVVVGDDKEFEIVADDEHVIYKIVVDGDVTEEGEEKEDYIYEFKDVQRSHEIEALFIKLYKIEAEAGDGGTITPSGTVEVKEGYDKKFTIDAHDDYVIDEVLIDGSSTDECERGSESCDYTFEDVQEDHEIEATFQIICDPDQCEYDGECYDNNTRWDDDNYCCKDGDAITCDFEGAYSCPGSFSPCCYDEGDGYTDSCGDYECKANTYFFPRNDEHCSWQT